MTRKVNQAIHKTKKRRKTDKRTRTVTEARMKENKMKEPDEKKSSSKK